MSLEESTIKSKDGLQLQRRRWSPDGTPIAEVLILHGYFEHGGRYQELAERLNRDGIAATLVDLRGHGKSEGMRGHISQFSDYLDDLRLAMNSLPEGPKFLLGHSLGGLIALTWAQHNAAKLAGLIVTNPFLQSDVDVPAWKLGAAKLLVKLRPAFALDAGLKPTALTRSADKVREYETDAWVFRKATAGWFDAVTKAQTELMGNSRFECPVFYVIGTADTIASPSQNLAYSQRLSAKEKVVKVLNGHYHEVLNEPERADLMDEIARWIKVKVLPKEMAPPTT
jgi:alpha-beta hydrolase superfamily lysophospholipase